MSTLYKGMYQMTAAEATNEFGQQFGQANVTYVADRLPTLDASSIPYYSGSMGFGGSVVNGFGWSPIIQAKGLGPALSLRTTAATPQQWDLGIGGAGTDLYVNEGNATRALFKTGGAFVLGADPTGIELLRVGGGVRANGSVTSLGSAAVIAHVDGALSFNAFVRAAQGQGYFQVYNGAAGAQLNLNGVTPAPVVVGADPGGTSLFRVGGDVNVGAGNGYRLNGALALGRSGAYTTLSDATRTIFEGGDTTTGSRTIFGGDSIEFYEHSLITMLMQVDVLSNASQLGLNVNYNGTMKRILVGAADSAGTGYRALKIAN